MSLVFAVLQNSSGGHGYQTQGPVGGRLLIKITINIETFIYYSFITGKMSITGSKHDLTGGLKNMDSFFCPSTKLRVG